MSLIQSKISEINKRFDEKYNELSLDIEREWGALSNENKTFDSIRPFLNLSLIEVLTAVGEVCCDECKSKINENNKI